MARTLLFVYGTLRRGGSSAMLMEEAEFLGTHVTGSAYSLYDCGDYPAAVAGGSTSLKGEVYAVSAGIMSATDRLEEYPQVYTRVLIPTPWGEAWIYLMQAAPQHGRLVADGEWAAS